MTQVKIIKKNNFISQVVCLGHTGYAKNGEDIVCSALSSVVQTALLGLLTVANINVETVKDDETGYLSFKLPQNLTEKQKEHSQIILNTMFAGVSDLANGYSNFISLEVKS